MQPSVLEWIPKIKSSVSAPGSPLFRPRGVWKPEKGGVRESAVTSADGGKTWEPWFDLMFRPAASTESKNVD